MPSMPALKAIHVMSKRSSLENLKKKFPEAQILDLTSKGAAPWVQFSPFYPHGGIPVPFSPGQAGSSVEGIWQGLKVFEKEDVDRSKLAITNMSGIKRSSRKFGKVLGHRAGIDGNHLLSYLDARRQIYLPTYLWVLQNKLQDEIAQLKEIASQSALILLDYETNTDLNNLSKPLSHASLVKNYLEDNWSTA